MKKILKIISMLFVIAAVVFAAGCTEEAEPAEDVTENNTAENNTTEVNETAETGLLVTEADNGTSISLKNGENFTLQLWENPSTGYSWQLNLSEGLSILDDYHTPDPHPEGSVGFGGTHTWIIEAVNEGSQQINGIYKQSWMNTTGTEDNFTLTVEVV